MNSYNKIGWVNGGEPPLSAENLNHMDDGIEAATEAITSLEGSITDTNNALAAKVDKLPQGSNNVFLVAQNLGIARSIYTAATSVSEVTVNATSKLVTAALIRSILANYYTQSEIDLRTYTKSDTDDKIFELLDWALSGSDAPGSPSLLLDKVIDGTHNPSGHYILYYLDSDDNRHNLFDFSQYFAEKSNTLAGYGITNAYTKEEINALISTAGYAGSWSDVQKVVRAGLAPVRYPVGFEFNVNKGDENIIFVVRGYNTITSPDSGATQYSMILESKYTYVSLQYDAPEYSGLAMSIPSGAAVFYINSYTANMKHFMIAYQGYKHFTLTNNLEPGNIIVISGSNVYVYDNASSSTVKESVLLYNGTGGYELSNYCRSCSSDLTNDENRQTYGSNNYAQSAIRQYLNSSADAESVWMPSHPLDAPPSWAGEKDGFLKDIDSEFLSVVANANVICQTNTVYETDGYTADGNNYVLTDKFFILSRAELLGVGSDGVQLEYYRQIDDYIKYNTSDSARAYLTRTPVYNNSRQVRYINTDGVISVGIPRNNWNICPACIIA